MDDADNNEIVSSTMRFAASGKKDGTPKVLTFEIVPIEFETASRLKLFLESLFQLKPNLLSHHRQLLKELELNQLCQLQPNLLRP